jgi:protein ImuB
MKTIATAALAVALLSATGIASAQTAPTPIPLGSPIPLSTPMPMPTPAPMATPASVPSSLPLVGPLTPGH